MIYRYFFIIILLLVAHPLWGQTDSSTVVFKKVWNPNFAVKVAPLRIFEPYHTFQVGVAYRLAYQTTLEHEIGYGTSAFNLINPSVLSDRDKERNNLRNFRLSTTAKIFLHKMKMKGLYAGLTVGYRNSSFSVPGGATTCETSTVMGDPTLDYYTTKQDLTCRFLLGKQCIFEQRFLLDYYAGIGFKYLVVDTEEGSTLACSQSTIEIDHTITGNYFLPALALGFKVGILFHKRE